MGYGKTERQSIDRKTVHSPQSIVHRLRTKIKTKDKDKDKDKQKSIVDSR